MSIHSPGYLKKLAWSLPWLARYPLWRAAELVRRMSAEEESGPQQIMLLVANHFEPGWSERGERVDWDTQRARVERWCERARALGTSVRDHNGAPFRHTLFYPGEEYHAPLLDRMAQLQREGFGDVEVHLHHGVERPDTAANLRRLLTDFRDLLADEHECLSRMDDKGLPMYAFVHGNLALANSAGGRCCGVDSEMQILAETGCYADFTLPSAPDQSQVPRLNDIYQCGHPLEEARPHRSGPSVRQGAQPTLPVIFTGPLVFDWRRRVRGLPVPRLDDGALAANYLPELTRFEHWRNAHISVSGRPGWIFIKLYCHGFFPQDESAMIGDEMQRFLENLLELAERSGEFKLHFTTAREAFNIALAAVDGRAGDPGQYRDYRLRPIMHAGSTSSAALLQEEPQPSPPVTQAVS